MTANSGASSARLMAAAVSAANHGPYEGGTWAITHFIRASQRDTLQHAIILQRVDSAATSGPFAMHAGLLGHSVTELIAS